MLRVAVTWRRYVAPGRVCFLCLLMRYLCKAMLPKVECRTVESAKGLKNKGERETGEAAKKSRKKWKRDWYSVSSPTSTF